MAIRHQKVWLFGFLFNLYNVVHNYIHVHSFLVHFLQRTTQTGVHVSTFECYVYVVVVVIVVVVVRLMFTRTHYMLSIYTRRYVSTHGTHSS